MTNFHRHFIVLLLVFLTGNLYAQQQKTSDKHITTVFNKLVAAYGHAKAAPKLKIVHSNSRLNTPARYYSSPSPTIKVDAYLYTICNRFGAEKHNALAIVLGHELAHYYNDHTFCADFAFAIRKEQTGLSSKLKALSKTEKLALETEADHNGLFYSCMAGYKPFGIYPKLLDAIYKDYQLPEHVTDYPSKTERKALNLQAQEKVKKLHALFIKGIADGKKGNYDCAIEKFETINRHFPSRENYNNIGVYYTLKALSIYPISRAAYLKPKRFTYPVQIDKDSRLVLQTQTRSTSFETQKTIKTSLLNAKKSFEKSISLDPVYYNAFINLACVYDLLDNPEAALGKIKELPKHIQRKNRSTRIKAIAYYHMELEPKALELWQELGI